MTAERPIDSAAPLPAAFGSPGFSLGVRRREEAAARERGIYPAVMWLRKLSGSPMNGIGSKLPPVPRTLTVP